MTHLYALCDRPCDLSGLAGVDDARLREVDVGDLRAVVSDHAATPRATRGRALAHAGVVAAVCERVPAVPVRYGSVHADVEALRAAVVGELDTLAAAIRRVADRVELLVRCADPPSTAALPVERRTEPGEHSPGAGRAYLETRLEREQAAWAARRRAAEELRARIRPFEAHAVAVCERDGPQGPERCLLVPRDGDEVLRELVEEAARSEPRLVVGGPWPPYSFL